MYDLEEELKNIKIESFGVHNFERQLSNVKEFANRVENFLETEAIDLKFYYEQQLDELSNDETLTVDSYEHYAVDWGAQFSDESALFEYHLPVIARSSLFLSCYGYFEYFLFRICKFYDKESMASVSLKDIAGMGIRKFRIFLKHSVGIDFPDQIPEWSTLLFYNDLRNKIAHNNSRLDPEQKSDIKLIKQIEQNPFLSFNQPNYQTYQNNYQRNSIIFEKGFVPSVVSTMETFWKELAQKTS